MDRQSAMQAFPPSYVSPTGPKVWSSSAFKSSRSDLPSPGVRNTARVSAAARNGNQRQAPADLCNKLLVRFMSTAAPQAFTHTDHLQEETGVLRSGEQMLQRMYALLDELVVEKLANAASLVTRRESRRAKFLQGERHWHGKIVGLRRSSMIYVK
ncbi:hypothetical protein CBOM_05672 [Ceraceosorus bombacis]|uniref:Uncharacterized protein n=1 Tax=Ceraceosorus bombacis TaxID=401625 RepID=A0A0P1BSH1_9BASI|nr:hypothetical protein CBOM_05672 [Ceraceosorus bombacis]